VTKPHAAGLAGAIGVFTRPPVAGQTKTRLIPAFGAQGAAQIHLRLLEKTLATASASGAALTLWVTDSPDHSTFKALAGRFGCRIQMQQGADLGARMQYALESMLAQHPHALVIGSDCAVHSAQSLQSASAALHTAEMVFTPAEDGGYVLVGARTAIAQAKLKHAFAGIAWGTAQVMQQTRERLSAAAVSWQELPALWDIDTPADVARAQSLGLL
jgi:uncharacterized protein